MNGIVGHDDVGHDDDDVDNNAIGTEDEISTLPIMPNDDTAATTKLPLLQRSMMEEEVVKAESNNEIF